MHKRGPSKSQILCTFQFSHIQWLYISKGILKYRHSFNNAFQAIPVLILLCGLLFKTKVMNLCVLEGEINADHFKREIMFIDVNL